MQLPSDIVAAIAAVRHAPNFYEHRMRIWSENKDRLPDWHAFKMLALSAICATPN